MKKPAFVVIGVVLALSASCKKDTPSETTNTSASSTAGNGGVVSGGACKFVADRPRCQPGGKAAFCAMGPAPDMKIAWQTFTCADCQANDKGVRCSDYVVGEACDMLATPSSACSKDGKSEYTCDMASHKWTIEPCPGGCKGDMTNGLSCSK